MIGTSLSSDLYKAFLKSQPDPQKKPQGSFTENSVVYWKIQTSNCTWEGDEDVTTDGRGDEPRGSFC